MDILVKSPHKTKEVHPARDRKIYEEEIASREAILKDPWYLKRISAPQDIRRKLKDYKRNYERGLPEQLPPEVVNRLWRRAKQLKDEIVQGMVPKNLMHPVKHTVFDGKKVQVIVNEDKLNSSRAAERDHQWNKVNGAKIQEFKKIMRQLAPDNPTAANLERWRPEH